MTYGTGAGLRSILHTARRRLSLRDTMMASEPGRVNRATQGRPTLDTFGALGEAWRIARQRLVMHDESDE